MSNMNTILDHEKKNSDTDILLTIAIPTYNRASFLKRALDSILAQYDSRIEILVSDNASTDETDEMMRREYSRYPFIRYNRNSTNLGSMKNFIFCYKNAHGKFVQLLGSDDVVTEGSIPVILTFLQEHPDLDCLFLNDAAFEGEYRGVERCRKPYMNIQQDIVTESKEEFMSHAKERITFMSDLVLANRIIDKVQNFEIYEDTSFLHTCVLFEGTADSHKFGILCKVCIANDQNDPSPETAYSANRCYQIFGLRMHHVFCDIAAEYGYDREQMRKIHECFLCKSRWHLTIRYKAKNDAGQDEAFRRYMFPVLKTSLKAWLTVMPLMLIPKWLARFAYERIKPLIRKS